MLPQKNNINTILPHNKNSEKAQSNKRKSSHKLNASDFLVNKKKVMKKMSKKFTDLINLNEKNTNNISNKPKIIRRGSFTLRNHIKNNLLKEYKDQLRMEKKYRKIIITNNLSDSMEEESAEEDENTGLKIYISSESTFILIFDIIMIFFSFYLLLFIPLCRAERKNYYNEEKKIYELFNMISEILFILDLFISFFRTYYNFEYKKITDTNKIIKHYLTEDFLMDLLEAFPSFIISKKLCYKNVGINAELTGFEITMTIFQIVKTMKIWKVLDSRKNRAIEIFHEKISEQFFWEKFFNIFVFLFKILSFLHILICIHIFLGWQSYPNWMTHVNIIDEELITKYICSFYFIIETMTTVGYGDIVCISPIERFFQLILLSIGIVSYSFIITKFGNYVMKQSNEEIELEKKINQLEQIRIQYPLIPYKLYMKIHDYFKKKSLKNNNNSEMKNLVINLPDKLRNDLILVIFRNVIDHFFVFKGCNNTDFITQMCTAFILTTVGKETILIQESKKVENIIFVKDGRLILEAKINLSNPSKSYEKYFRENFNGINVKAYQKLKNSVSAMNSGFELKQMDNSNCNNYLNLLEEKIKDKNKIEKKGNSFFDVTRGSVSFQADIESDEDEEKADFAKEGRNYQYLKILDIRKNEHFGDVYMFLDKPAPLTLKVKSKIAQIFILRKKDAMNINNIHHNIMNRIRQKSFKNLISIKNKTIQILKKYTSDNLSKLKRTQIQNTSWFNEKSRNNALQDITNFLNNSINLIEKVDLFPSCKLNSFMNSPMNMTRVKSLHPEHIKLRTPKINNNKISSLKGMRTLNATISSHTKFNKKFAGIRTTNQTEFSSISSKNNLLSQNYEPKINKNKINNKSLNLQNGLNSLKIKIDNIDKIDKSHQNLKYSRNYSKKSYKNVTFKCDQQETISLSKDLKESSLGKYSEISFKNTKEEEKITTINDIYTDNVSKIRNKIKFSVKKEKLLKLCKKQKKMLESYEKKVNERSNSNDNNLNNIEDKDLKKISELNNTIYNKILHYLDLDDDTEIEGEKNISNKNEYKPIKLNSFSIKSSYSNLNHLTKGKIIINNNYKIDIKNLVKNYIKERNKDSNNTLDNFVKTYYNDYHYQKQVKFNNDSPKKKKKVKFKIPHSSRNLNFPKDKIVSPFISNYQIKKTITNKKNAYKNFKNFDIKDKFSQMKLKNKNIPNNSSSKYYTRGNSLENIKSNSANGFTKFINSIFSILKGKNDY